MNARQITMTDVMFDGDGERESFPTLAELANDYTHVNKYSLGNLCDDDMFGGWLAIARDPHSLMYGDDSHEAMDETNYDAIVSELSAVPVHLVDIRHADGSYRPHVDTIREAMEAGCAVVEHVLIIKPRDTTSEDYDEADMDDLWNMAQLRAQLADYPLLDEEAFSEREYAEWQEYAPMALGDEIRNARRDHEDYASDSALDDIDEHAEELLPILSQQLHHFDGWGGGYAPSFLSILADIVKAGVPDEDAQRQTTTAQDAARVLNMLDAHTLAWVARQTFNVYP